jgi:HlyD family secretion protein
MFDIISKLHSVMTPSQFRHYLWLQLLFAVTALIQVAGVASIAPFIALLSNPAAIHNNPITTRAYEFVGAASDVHFMMLFALAIMAFVVISNIVVAITNWLMFRFTFTLGSELQGSAYKSYVSKEFTFYGKTNSSQMVTILTQEIPRYVYNVILPFLTFSSQLFIAAIILGGLILIDPLLAIAAGVVVAGGYLLVFRLLKERLAADGDNLWTVGNLRVKLMNESLGGIKELRLLGSESIYVDRLNEANLSMMRSQALIGISSELPKFIIETIAFCALLGLALYLLSKHGNSSDVISILSLYAMAGYKLLPAGQGIYKSASQIKANGAALNEFLDEVTNGRNSHIGRETQKHLEFDGSISLENIYYQYPEAKSEALQNICLSIPSNSIIAFVGSSGAGKSTLADIILGMLQPTSGRLRAGNIEITPENASSWHRNLGYVPQNIFIIDDSIKANIAFGTPTDKVDLQKVKRAAEMANLADFIEGLPERYEYRVGERGSLLSGGQRQRLGIARALYHDAKILVLDEATSALDNVTEAEVIATINTLKKSKTIIMIAHRLSTIKAADEIIVMEGGKIIESGKFDELSGHSLKFREMLHISENGNSASLTHHSQTR